ncbi:MAG: FCD domain-containing protein [Propionibacteriales bacterium]|nr:FCD domain-containing protein [Propionibacteriales bacterium]
MTGGARTGAGPRPDRSSAAERAADELRRRITEGELTPQARLSEESLVDVLHVSRNTLREAFRLLTHEGLLVYRLNRGVFVPELDEDDLVDLYRLRRAIECDAVRTLRDLDETRLQPLRADVADGEASARRGDWRQVGTANMSFHRHLVGLAGSRRIDEVTARLLAELRLAFHIIDIPQELHEPNVARNRALVELLAAGDVAGAAAALEAYLLDSEARLLEALRERRAPSGGAAADADR